MSAVPSPRARLLEFGASRFYPAFEGAQLARESEEMGLDIHGFPENHAQVPDAFGEMRDAIRSTSRIRLLCGPVNFVTRNPGVVAAGILPIQILSEGRAICGVASGDSAVAAAGKPPQKSGDFERDLAILRSYLHGGEADFGESVSRIAWADRFTFDPPPLQMACSGPKSIVIATRHADRIWLGVGASPERVKWALGIVDNALSVAGRDRSDIRIGMSVPIAITPDRASGRALMRTRVAPWAHMSSGKGIDLDRQPEILRRVTSVLRDTYDYRHHGSAPVGNPNNDACDEDFADWMGIGGPPSYVVERLGHLVDLGIDFFMTSLSSPELEQYASDVIPPLRVMRG